ncbi:unnamed protein product [Mytilus edulis]|uniref:Uncharacterized protein n=1 Tax=Mytilus edulis TaxID=6550 RepID=A0A8S3SEF8_MYTED|nr:unnamed protein product [Mytilus edulis]
MNSCKFICNGSKKDPCGSARFFTVYEQEVEKGTTYNRRPVIKWITNETFAEISNETADFHNVKCLLLENLRYVPTSCNLNYSALCESGSERELTTETNEITMETSLSTTRLKMTTILEISSTASSDITQSFFETTTHFTGTFNIFGIFYVLAVVAGLITITIAVPVILIHHKRKRKRSQFNSRKSVITTTNCYEMSWNKKGFTMGTKDLEEVYSYYSLPYNSVSQLPAVNIDEIKAGPSMTTKGDEGHGHIAYFHTAIVHGDFLYYIPRHSCKSLENRCSVIK